MSLNFAAIPEVLYNPKSAFGKIKDATMMEGIILAVIFGAVSFGIAYLLSMGAFGIFGGALLTYLAIAFVIGVVGFVAVGYLSALLAQALGGKSNPGTTIGFLGYVSVIGLIQTIVFNLLGSVGISAGFSAASFSGAGLTLVFSLLFLVWMVWAGGTAVAEANGLDLVKGAATYFISSLVVGIVMAAIVAAVMYPLLGQAFAAGLAG
ncbi:MAG: YIP1 family protein [Candidatus Micrarchaeota archaeon]